MALADGTGGQTLPGRLLEVCRREGERLAIIDGSTRLTFTDVSAAVERVAGHLRDLGVGPDRVVSWQLPNWWEAAVIHHAILRAGGIPNPVNPALRGRELLTILEEARPMLLIAPETWRGADMAASAKQARD